jgi:hypothetical protein
MKEQKKKNNETKQSQYKAWNKIMTPTMIYKLEPITPLFEFRYLKSF